MEGLRRIHFTLIAFLFSFGALSILKAQELSSVHFSTENGLPSNTIYTQFQDKEGRMWFATDNGVCRFNGQKFDYYGLKDGLPDQEIFTICQDKENRIWFAGMNGKTGFFLKEKFYNDVNFPALKDFKSQSLISYSSSTAKGETYFFSFFSYQPEILIWKNNNTFKKIRATDDGTSFHRFISLPYWINDSSFIINSANGIFSISGNSVKQIYRHVTFPSYVIQTIILNQNEILLFEKNLLIRKNLSSNKDEAILKIETNNVTGIRLDSKNRLWIFVQGCAYCYDIQTKIVKKWFSGHSINGILEDINKNIWFYSGGKGSYLVKDLSSRVWKPFSKEPINIYSVMDDGKSIWFAGEGGKLGYIDVNGLQHLKALDPTKFESRMRIKAFRKLNEDKILAVLEPGLLLIEKGKLKAFMDKALKAIELVGDDIYLGSNRSLFKISQKDLDSYFKRLKMDYFGKFEKHDSVQRQFFKTSLVDFLVSEKRVYTLCKDGNEKLFLGTGKGLFCYSLKTKEEKKLPCEPPLNDASIIDLCQLRDGKLLASVSGFGLCIWDGRILKRLHDFEEQNQIKRLKRENDSTAWICSDKGVFQIRWPKSKVPSINYHPFPNFFGKDFPDANDLEITKDQIIIALNDKITVFNKGQNDPLEIRKSQIPILSGLRLNGKRLPVGENQELDLEYPQISLSFYIGDFTYYNQLLFRYRLSSSDKWVVVKSGEQVLSKAGPGKFRIEVQCKYPDAAWSESAFYPTFTLLPPLWKRPWIVSTITFFACLLLFFVGYIVYRYKEEKEILDLQLAELNVKALKAQIKPHFIFNALISVQRYVLRNEKEKTLEFLSRFSRHIRQVLEDSELHFHSLTKEIEILNDYLALEKDRVGDKLDYTIEVEKDLNKSLILIPTLLLQPLIENAVWHGINPLEDRQGLIQLRFKQTYNLLLIDVEDNGMGRNLLPKDLVPGKTSFGISNIEQRIALLGKKFKLSIRFEIHDLKNEQNKPVGTLVSLAIPLIIDNK